MVITKPSQQNAAEITPLRSVRGAEMADHAGQHPGHDQLGDEGIDEGQECARLAPRGLAIFSGVMPSAAIQVLPRLMYQPAPASQATTAAITMAR